MKVSTVLRKAAKRIAAHKTRYCCNAVRDVQREGNGTYSAAHEYLYSLGVGAGYGEFDEFEDFDLRREVRYAWLLFAADLWDEGFRP